MFISYSERFFTLMIFTTLSFMIFRWLFASLKFKFDVIQSTFLPLSWTKVAHSFLILHLLQCKDGDFFPTLLTFILWIFPFLSRLFYFRPKISILLVLLFIWRNQSICGGLRMRFSFQDPKLWGKHQRLLHMKESMIGNVIDLQCPKVGVLKFIHQPAWFWW